MYDIIIIGAGPAGMTAAIYGKRALKSVLILEAITYGGQIINTLDIENYPVEAHISGFDFATKLYNQVIDLGAEIKYEKVTEIIDKNEYKEVMTSKNTYQAKTIIIATGADNRKLGLENENDLIGKGISYCATCDGNFFKKKDVAVVGGGNTALEDALYLSSIANKVYLIHRRDQFRGDQSVVEKLKEQDNVEFVYNSNVTKLIADESLASIEVTNKDGSTKNIPVKGLFIAIGKVPENENFKNLINVDEAGYIIADESCHTNIPGIFVAGDTRNKELRQLVTATADGAIAATEAVKYLNN
ncbi:MAG: thioredoxin-disulfide reductase [Bacilli bacterium]|nr:thioredoxin-disulfide reductase [Bacilli bacterium]MBQ7240966.1 thioredoxin-disulfide reductase [Bacilli bacterium]